MLLKSLYNMEKEIKIQNSFSEITTLAPRPNKDNTPKRKPQTDLIYDCGQKYLT